MLRLITRIARYQKTGALYSNFLAYQNKKGHTVTVVTSADNKEGASLSQY